VSSTIDKHLRSSLIKELVFKLTEFNINIANTGVQMQHISLKGRPGSGKTHLINLAMKLFVQQVDIPLSCILINILNSPNIDIAALLDSFLSGDYDSLMKPQEFVYNDISDNNLFNSILSYYHRP